MSEKKLLKRAAGEVFKNLQVVSESLDKAKLELEMGHLDIHHRATADELQDMRRDVSALIDRADTSMQEAYSWAQLMAE